MIYAIAAALALVCLALIGALLLAVMFAARERHQLAELHNKHVRELEDRIQAPQQLPYRPVDELVAVPEREPDGWNTVGQIHIDENYLTSDED